MLFFRLWVVLLFTYPTLLRADCTSLEKNLGESSLQALKDAQHITVEKNVYQDPNDVHEYEVKILYSGKLQKFLVILGEYHVKTEGADEIGKKVIHQFGLRGFEFPPQEETSKLSLREQIKWIAAYETINPILSKGSTIAELLQQGITLAPKNWHSLGDMTKTLIDYHAFMYDDLDPFIEANDYVNIALETGCIVESVSLSDPQYIFNDRNERMVENIVNILSKTQRSPSLLIVVGKAHIPGVTDLLINQFEFEQCAF